MVHLLMPLHIQKTLDYLLVLTKWWSLLQGAVQPCCSAPSSCGALCALFFCRPLKKFLRLCRSRNSPNSLQGSVSNWNHVSATLACSGHRNSSCCIRQRWWMDQLRGPFRSRTFWELYLSSTAEGLEKQDRLPTAAGLAWHLWQLLRAELNSSLCFQRELNRKAQTGCKVALMSGNWLEVAN